MRPHNTIAAGDVSLENAVVVVPEGLTGLEARAVAMLVEEVEKRSQIRWPVAREWPSEPVPVVGVGPAAAVERFAGPHAAGLAGGPAPPGPEGYQLRVRGEGSQAAVFVLGSDARGVLFGAG